MHFHRTGIILFTENYDRCVDFYTRVLGLRVMFAVDIGHSKLTCCDVWDNRLEGSFFSPIGYISRSGRCH